MVFEGEIARGEQPFAQSTIRLVDMGANVPTVRSAGF
jgi:hypothetical protein